MKKKVLSFIHRHHLLEKDTTVLVAVSGGPDSMALLHLLHDIKEEWNLRIIAITVDHQLRGEEARADVRYVQTYCEQIDVAHDVVTIDVNKFMKEQKVGTQVAARTLRYEVFAEKMKEYDAHYIAMGHHGDDQIETMVMSLARTTVLSSLTGIPYARPLASGTIIRPLLTVTKGEIEDYCLTYRLSPRIDPTNFEQIYTRNKIRLTVLPTLKEVNSNVHITIQRLTETLQEDELYLLEQAKTMKNDLLTYDKTRQRWTFEINHYKQYALPLQRRCFRLTLDYLYKKLPDNLSHIHETLFLQLQEDTTSNQVLHFPQGLFIEKTYDQIHFYFKQKTHEAFEIKVEKVPTTITLPNGHMLAIEQVATKEASERYTYTVPVSKVQLPFHIRTRKEGDRMTYKGLNGTKKLKDILMDEKIPREERKACYIVTDDTEAILWLIGLRKNEIENIDKDEEYILFTYIQ